MIFSDYKFQTRYDFVSYHFIEYQKNLLSPILQLQMQDG